MSEIGLFKAIYTQRAIRRLKPDPVSDELIDKLIEAATKAPPGAAWVTPSYYGSIFPAVQNLLLAARGLGLGATLTTLHKMHDADVKELLGIPNTVETVALIPIGYPEGKYGPTKRRPVDEVTHRERWDASKA